MVELGRMGEGRGKLVADSEREEESKGGERPMRGRKDGRKEAMASLERRGKGRKGWR